MSDKDERMTGNGTLGHSPLTELGQICPVCLGLFHFQNVKS